MPSSASAQPSPPPQPVSKDRRKSTRFASGQPASCRPTASSDVTPVRIKDVSKQGLGLLSSRRFEVGSVLLVELGDSAPHPVTALARVVRLGREPDGTWIVGCMFFSDLNKEDLSAFQAKGTSAAPSDRRANIRLPVNRMASCRRHTPGAISRWPVEVKDESSDGLGLLCYLDIEDGAKLRIDLPPQGPEPPRTILVSVVRRVREPDGRWLLGCTICPK